MKKGGVDTADNGYRKGLKAAPSEGFNGFIAMSGLMNEVRLLTVHGTERARFLGLEGRVVEREGAAIFEDARIDSATAEPIFLPRHNRLCKGNLSSSQHQLVERCRA